MLYFVTKAYSSRTIWDFIWGAGWRRVPFLRPLTYEQLFHSQRAPLGHYVFTDFDRMSAYEIHAAGHLARQLVDRDGRIRIYNDPTTSLERVALLTRLHDIGFNDFSVTRIDLGQRPPAYPVFIRCEDDCKRPDTGLLLNDAEFDAALADMRGLGVPLKRRIAVQYRAQASADGYFKKYGALRVGGRVILQHILRNTDWYVKRGQVERDAQSEREFAELFDNYSHVPEIEKAFAAGGIDYGRVDYSIVDGRIQVYEINTNPTIPKLRRKRAHNNERYLRLAPMLLDGFAAMDVPHASGTLKFDLPKPVYSKFPPLDIQTSAYLAKNWVLAAGTLLKNPPIPGVARTR